MKTVFTTFTLALLFPFTGSAQATIAEQLASGDLVLEGDPAVIAKVRELAETRRQQSAALEQLRHQQDAETALWAKPVNLARARTVRFLDDVGAVIAHGSIVHPGFAIAKSSEIRSFRGKCRMPDGTEGSFLASRRSLVDDLVLVRLPDGGSAIDHPLREATHGPGAFVLASTASQPCAQGIVSVAARPIRTMTGKNLESSVLAFERHMKLEVSQRRTGFVFALETDLNLTPAECGAPVVDLEGAFVGMALARAARHSTLVLPASRIRLLLEQWDIL